MYGPTLVLYLYAQMGQVVSLSRLCARGGKMLSSPIFLTFAALGTAPADPLRYLLFRKEKDF